jgi:GAF domain-containing protein
MSDTTRPKNPAGADPLHDRERLEEIAALRLLDPDVQEILDDVVKQAAEVLGAPTSLLTIVLDDAQYFAASHGLGGWLKDVGGTPVEWSFCANAVRSGEPFVVSDACADDRVSHIPLVELDGVRCYAGIPLTTSRGFVVGTLCVIGSDRRTFDEERLAALRDLAREAMRRIEARRQE